jgi:hypothetical protein
MGTEEFIRHLPVPGEYEHFCPTLHKRGNSGMPKNTKKSVYLKRLEFQCDNQTISFNITAWVVSSEKWQ